MISAVDMTHHFDVAQSNPILIVACSQPGNLASDSDHTNYTNGKVICSVPRLEHRNVSPSISYNISRISPVVVPHNVLIVL